MIKGVITALKAVLVLTQSIFGDELSRISKSNIVIGPKIFP